MPPEPVHRAALQAQAAAFRECAPIATGAKIPFNLPIRTCLDLVEQHGPLNLLQS